MFSRDVPGRVVEKVMSFTEAEFENGLARLTGSAVRKTDSGAYDLSDAAGGVLVTCTFTPQPDAVLGGLVRLPRVAVILDMSPLGDAERSRFLNRFEKTFQRGGG